VCKKENITTRFSPYVDVSDMSKLGKKRRKLYRLSAMFLQK